MSRPDEKFNIDCANSQGRALLEEVKGAVRDNSTAMVMFLEVIGARFGLSVTDAKTLDILMRKGGLSAGEIAEHTGLATPSVTALIDRLEKKEFVRRVRDTTDRRRVIVEPNYDRFHHIMAQLSSFKRALDEMFARYSDEELRLIQGFLIRCTQCLREETAKLSVLHLNEEESG